MFDGAPGVRNPPPIEASGVPLCTSVPGDGFAEMRLYYQTFERISPAGFAAHGPGRIHRICSIFEQGYSRHYIIISGHFCAAKARSSPNA
jgi:hypothetical protein